MPRRLIHLVNPENRRAVLFAHAMERVGWGEVVVVPYLRLLRGEVDLRRVIRAGDVVRLDSPGENGEVERELLRLGIGDANAENSPYWDERQLSRWSADDVGRIVNPRQWYHGFQRLLGLVQDQLAASPPHHLLNELGDVGVMFDKIACQERFALAGIPIPDRLVGVASFDSLRERMNQAGLRRVFVKLAHGSSASGVVALERTPTGFRAVTSVEVATVGGEIRLYNSLRLKTYRDSTDIRVLMDQLIPQRVQVERWLPKAALNDRLLDVRVLTIHGRAGHFVVRTSRSPLTNLHLGNRRGDAGLFLERVGVERWQQAREACERVAACFPRSLHVGVDLLFTPGFRGHAILEANAFGDLLPNILHDGYDSYEAEIRAIPGFAR